MAKKIRILHIFGTFHIGGMETHLLNFFNRADFDRFEHFLFVGRDEGQLREAFHALPVRIVKLNFTPKHYFYSIPYGLYFCLRNGIGILHGHNYWAYLYCFFLSLISGIPFITADYGLGTWKKKIHHAWESSVFGRAKVNMAVSQAILDKNRSLVRGGGGGRFELVYPIIRDITPEIVHEEEKRGIKLRLGIDGDSPVLTIIGRIIRLKGHRFAIEAVDRINAQGDRATLLIVGRRGENGVLEEKDIEKDHVFYTDFYERIEEIWAVTDLFLIPSTSEGTPLVLLEYFAIGKPVIASDISGTRELIRDGWNGFLFKSGDAGDLKEKIERAIRSEDLGAIRSNAVRYFTENLSPEVQTRKIEDLYGESSR